MHVQHRKKRSKRLSEGAEMREAVHTRGGENERNSSFLVVMVRLCTTCFWKLGKRTPFLLYVCPSVIAARRPRTTTTPKIGGAFAMMLLYAAEQCSIFLHY